MPWHTSSYLITVIFTLIIIGSNCFDFSTRVNFEKLYHIEEELIAISDLILKQEKRDHDQTDVHGLFQLEGTIEKIKDIHKNVTSTYRLMDYFSHPLNFFHITKRLVRTWRNVVDLLMESATCVKTMRVKLQNIDDHIPTEDQLHDTAYKILLGLQIYQNFTPSDIMKGTISEMQPEEPMELLDAFDFGKAAYNHEDYYLAIDWLEYVNTNLATNTQATEVKSLNKTIVLSRLASAYFKNGWMEKAVHAIDELLKLEPNNKMAKRNKEYFEGKSSTTKPKPTDRPMPSLKFDRLVQQICKGSLRKNSSLTSRLSCVYLPRRNQTKYERSDVKAEVFNRKPLIIRFPNVFSKSIVKAIQFLGYDDMVWYASKVLYREPKDRVHIRDKTYHKWVTKTRKHLSNIKLSDGRIKDGTLFVQNVGFNGFQEKKEKRPKEDSRRPLGSMIIFVSCFICKVEKVNDLKNGLRRTITKCIPNLTISGFIGDVHLVSHGKYLSNSTLGGELVFPMSRTYIPVSAGDVVFYEEGAQFAVCPVLYGSQWYGFTDMTEPPKYHHCYLERRVPIL